MGRLIKYYLGFCIIFLGLFSCESLEDTYKDYAGGGIVKYLGQIQELKVHPEWKQLRLEWIGVNDPKVVGYKVQWSYGDDIQEIIINKEERGCFIGCNSHGIYEVSVMSVDAEGNESKKVQQYVQPFTDQHPNVIGFPKGVSKHFKIGGKLFLLFEEWNANMVSLKLKYTDKSGTTQEKELTEQILAQKYMLIDDINVNEEISVLRVGNLVGAENEITFAPHILTNDITFSTDFSNLLREKHGITYDNIEKINEITTLEIDYSMESLEDILFFPNLKILKLGAGRYLRTEAIGKPETTSSLDPKLKSISLKILEIASKNNGLIVQRHNNHYFTDAEARNIDNFESLGNPRLPTLNYLNAENWTISDIRNEGTNTNEYIDNLIDLNYDSNWLKWHENMARSYEIVVDTKDDDGVIKGIRVAQIKNRTTEPDEMDDIARQFSPQKIVVMVSNDNIEWKNPFSSPDRTVGNSDGEITILNFPNPEQARYIKFMLSDMIHTNNVVFGAGLADIGIF